MIASLRAAWARRSEIDVFLLLQVCLFAAAVPALLRLKLAWLQWVLSRVPLGTSPTEARIHAIVRCTAVALRRGQPVIRRGCLTRGLTLYFFLRRAGLDVDLCFGAGYLGAEFAAHCWVEQGGEPFHEPVDPRRVYAEMYRVPPRTAGARRTPEMAGLRR